MDCLDKIEQKYRSKLVIIVPGGGLFADQVRLAQLRWKFDDRTAHCMAILAMQQMALMIAGLKGHFTIASSVRDIYPISHNNNRVIWSPDIVELDNSGIAATWDITSDSLAVWLAKIIAAKELLVIKSADIDADLSLQELAEQGIVDKTFCDFASEATVKIRLINAGNW